MEHLQILLILVAFGYCRSQILSAGTACKAIICKNGGTPTATHDQCLCLCPPTHRGLQCEIQLIVSDWPDGPYAIPMSVYGCPEVEGQGWSTGYLSMTFKKRLTKFHASLTESMDPRNLKLLGPYSDFVIQLNFCFKKAVVDHNLTSEQLWPEGKYGIYRVGNSCLKGFRETALQIRLPPLLHSNLDGNVPDFLLVEGKQSTNFTLHVCQKMEQGHNSDNKSEQNVTSSWNYPFILLKVEKEGGCEPFPGLEVEEEFLFLMRVEFVNYTNYMSQISNTSGEEYFGYCLYEKRRTGKSLDDIIAEVYGYETKQIVLRRAQITTGLSTETISKQDTTFLFAGFWTPTTRQWLFVDLQQTITANCILFDVVKKNFMQGSSLTVANDGLLTILSVVKWSFLTNGALRPENGLQFNLSQKILVQGALHRPLIGRYMAVIGDSNLFLLYEVVSIKIIGKGEGCGRNLGMRDGDIADFQISASTFDPDHPPHHARPDLQAWCSEISDVDPYLQIDLLVATVIEGVRIYNWPNKIEDNVSSNFEEDRPSGIRSFEVKYGFNSSHMTDYHDYFGSKKKFSLDMSLPTSNTQTVLFQKKFLASVLRIHGKGLKKQQPTCMRIEIIGCRKSKPQILGPIQRDPVSKAVVYPKGSVTTLKKPGVVTTFGYPMSYETGVTLAWDIWLKFGFIELLFTNISLNKYMPAPGSHNESCEDKILLGKTIAITPLKYQDDSSYLVVLNRSVNGHQIMLAHGLQRVGIIFQTCDDNERISSQGYGFRVIVRQAGIPTCTSGVNCEKMFSLQNNSIFMANSYLGLHQSDRLFAYWYIDVFLKDQVYIALTITELDINCDVGSALEILDGTRKLQYCNLKRPIGTIKSTNEILGIYLYKRQTSDRHSVDGFKAEISLVRHNKFFDLFNTTVLEGVLTEWQIIWYSSRGNSFDKLIDHQGIFNWKESSFGKPSYYWREFKVCADAFGKCYRFFRGWISMSLSAVQAEEHCEKTDPGGHLVQVNSKEESDFIAYKFLHVMKVRHVPDYAQSVYGKYAYIGLVQTPRKGNKRSGYVHGQWTTGNPVSYTAWGKPGNGLLNESCTRMNIFSLYGPYMWEAVPCKSIEAYYFTCEFQYKGRLENLHKSVKVPRTEMLNSKDHRHFECSSGELMSRLFLCDGLRDCLDGSDEKDCLVSDTCSKGYFQCTSGECVPISSCCDHVSDCEDNSDEYCAFPACNRHQFRCKNNQCIDSLLRCDAKQDCLDGTDEENCSACQEGTFLCMSSLCIPNAWVCDGFNDCVTGFDELNCDKTMDSCKDWWLAGHRKSGEYLIGNNKVECNFDNLHSVGVIQTLYYDIQGGESYRLGSENFVRSLIKRSRSCSQSIKQSCQPPADTISLEDGIAKNIENWPCFCIRSTYPGNGSDWKMDACSDEMLEAIAIHGEALLQEISNVEIDSIYYPHVFVKILDNSKPMRLQYEPIVCEEDFSPENDTMACGNEKVTSIENKCLYREDSNGHIQGCADLSHLQGCESFECPDGYAKCPNSYCLASVLLCDGHKQCPEGHDEVDCWCGESSSVLLMLYPDTRDLEDTVITMATQFHSPKNNQSNVLLIKFSELASSIENDIEILLQMDHFNSENLKQFNNPYKHTGTISGTFSVMKEWTTSQYKDMLKTLIYVENKRTMKYVNNMAFLNALNESVPDQFFKRFTVFIGKDSGASFQMEDHQRRFPPGTKFVHIKNPSLPETFALDSLMTVCPYLDSPRCPGLYRCHASRQCLSASYLCDGVRQCPYGDDERLCNFVCPENCSCHGYIVDCSHGRVLNNTLRKLSQTVRSLDLSVNNLSAVFDEVEMPYLVILNISRCRLKTIPVVLMRSLVNLKVLDLSFNSIQTIKKGDLDRHPKLMHISLTGNYDLSVIESNAFSELSSVDKLAIRKTQMTQLLSGTFTGMNLAVLDLSGNQLSVIEDGAFEGLRVGAINIQNNKIVTFGKEMFRGVSSLKTILSDAYKICCVRPDSVEEINCRPHQDEFSSCEDLMRNEALRFLLWIIGFIALIGNTLSLVYRLKFDRARLKLGFGIFVTNLAAADFLMGWYLVTIAIADLVFRGGYIFLDDWWRHSSWCNIAGVLATTSSEASVLFMCLITLDRLIVIKYPFGDVRIKTKTAYVLSVVTWAFVLLIALLPLVSTHFQNEFYSRSGVCLALPLTTTNASATSSAYSIALFIGFNFVTFLLVAVGQLLIYSEVHTSSKRIVKSARKNDLKIARNLLLIVTTDFMCWFPICIMGFLALGGVVIPGEVYAWSAVLVLPVNSALNPVLYTLLAVIGKKQFAPDVEEQSREVARLTKDSVEKILQLWKKRWFLPKTEIGGDVIPLSNLPPDELTSLKVLKISQLITQVICSLHALELVTGGLSKDDIYVQLKNQRVARILLKTSPSLVTCEVNKATDIKQIGCIISWLLEKNAVKNIRM